MIGRDRAIRTSGRGRLFANGEDGMKYSTSLAGVVAALLGLGSSLFGQYPATAPESEAAPPTVLPTPSAVDAPVPSPVAAPPMLSEWLVYPRSPICCGNVGKHGPVYGELYLRAGASQPLGTNSFTADMNTGFTSTFGSRTLLFNPAADCAFTVDFGITNTWWSLTNAPSYTLFDTPLPPNIFGQVLRGTQRVNPIRMHMMTLDLSGGLEYYVWGTAVCDGTSKCRVGFDVGGRYGTARMDFRRVVHRKDAVGGVLLAAHTDYECPFGICTFYAGARVEYGYLWNDLLQSHNDTDVQSVSGLVTLGLKF
jgi:hypothetical protein